MLTFLLLLAGCNGCYEIPVDGNPSDPRPDPAGEGDSSTDSGADSGPPAMCELVEVEPNPLATPQDLPMETQACGHFADGRDQDWFAFDLAEEGWVRLSLDAESRGSSADVQLQVAFTEADESVLHYDSYLTADAELIFPASQVGHFLAGASETTHLGGPGYSWYLMASVTKRPVDWQMEEIEVNDDLTVATILPMDTTVFGTISKPAQGNPDEDWYHINTPDGAQYIDFTVEAFTAGSAADITLQLWSSAGNLLFTDAYGEIDYDLDPYHETKVTVAHDWYLSVTNENAAQGSIFHWYTLTVTPIYGVEE